MLLIVKIIYDRGYYFEKKLYEGVSSSDNISDFICYVFYFSISGIKSWSKLIGSSSEWLYVWYWD